MVQPLSAGTRQASVNSEIINQQQGLASERRPSVSTPPSPHYSTQRGCWSGVMQYFQSLASLRHISFPNPTRTALPLNSEAGSSYVDHRELLQHKCAAAHCVMSAADRANLENLDQVAQNLSAEQNIPVENLSLSSVLIAQAMQRSIPAALAKIADDLVNNAVQAKVDIRSATAAQRNEALKTMGQLLIANLETLLVANQLDVTAYSKGPKFEPGDPKFNRMKLNAEKIKGFAESMERAAESRDPLSIGETSAVPNYGDMRVTQTGKPIGVICGIIEGRPNVILDFFAAFLKSGNVGIVRTGSEVPNTAVALLGLIHQALESAGLPANMYQMPSSQKREIINRLLEKRGEIDLVVPRGGYELVNHVRNTTQIPTISHPDGVCHMYFDQGIKPENLEKAIDVAAAGKLHAKGGVCGSTEGFLLDENLGNEKHKFILSKLADKFSTVGTTFHADPKAFKILSELDLPEKVLVVKATAEDYGKEYLSDQHCLVAMVNGVDDALNHINQYGSGHTDSCLTDDLAVWGTFKDQAKSVVVVHNAQTTFSDAELLLGLIEVGIAVPGSITTAEQLRNRVLVVDGGDYRQRGITDAVLAERAAAQAA